MLFDFGYEQLSILGGSDLQLHLHGAPFDLIVRPGSLASAQAAPRSLDEILCPHADYCERTPAGRRILLPCSSTTAPSRCTSSVSLQVIVDWLRWPERNAPPFELAGALG